MPSAAASITKAPNIPEDATALPKIGSVSVAAAAPPLSVANSLSASAAGPNQSIPAASPTGALQSALLIAPTKNNPDDTTEGRRLFTDSIDGSKSDPLNWSMHVYKSRHRIELYYQNHLFRTYHAVFGRSRWGGGKVWEGDSRTPEGAYLIIQKRRSTRFQWFLRLNYPNATDQERFAEMRAAREIPAAANEGGQVGIHGTDSPTLNVGDVNWTLGCISVSNDDIQEMARLLPIGTLVVINP
jgi:lipoprotein-anchoring transpeptidase ErfK/SrfK